MFLLFIPGGNFLLTSLFLKLDNDCAYVIVTGIPDVSIIIEVLVASKNLIGHNDSVH